MQYKTCEEVMRETLSQLRNAISDDATYRSALANLSHPDKPTRRAALAQCERFRKIAQAISTVEAFYNSRKDN